MDEAIISHGKRWHYVAHSPIRRKCPSILCIHGIGETGHSFHKVARELKSESVNVVIPDLLGYGKSSASHCYSFETQIEFLWKLVEHFCLERVVVLGHSMGGDIGTRMCFQNPGRVIGFVNIEGNLTFADTFICSQAVLADERGQFNCWIDSHFAGEPTTSVLKRYYASVLLCQKRAFLENARQMYLLSKEKLDGQIGEIALEYKLLPVRKLYCWANLSDETRAFLIAEQLSNEEFSGASHWLMCDQPKKLVEVVRNFLTS